MHVTWGEAGRPPGRTVGAGGIVVAPSQAPEHKEGRRKGLLLEPGEASWVELWL